VAFHGEMFVRTYAGTYAYVRTYSRQCVIESRGVPHFARGQESFWNRQFAVLSAGQVLCAGRIVVTEGD